MFPHALRVKPDISVSVHGLALGSCLHFIKAKNIYNGVDKHAHGSHGSATTSHTLYFFATG